MPRYVLPLFVAVLAAGAIWLTGEKRGQQAVSDSGD
jgi:hypothetical protein